METIATETTQTEETAVIPEKKKRGNPNWGKKNEASVDVQHGSGTIPIINNDEVMEDPKLIKVINDKQRHYMVIVSEYDEPKKLSTPVSDGQKTTYTVALNKEVILPEGALNTLKESIAPIVEDHYDAKEGKAWSTTREVARFLVRVIKEVHPDDAKKWYEEQKRINRAFYR